MGEDVKLPQYQCHKKVRAAKIVAIEHSGQAGRWILGLERPLELAGDVPVPAQLEIEHAWIERFSPEVGGYLVEYEDGYRSYSPAKAFEEGYTLLQHDAGGAYVLRKVSIAQIERLISAGVQADLQPDGRAKIYIAE